MTAHCILEDDLVLYALGELEGKQKRHLETHLSLCPACRRRIDQYRQLRGDVAVLTNAGKVARKRDDLKQRILAAAEAPQAPPGRPRREVWRWQPALAIMLALAVVVALASTSDVAGHFPFSQYIGFTPPEDRVDRSEHPANPAEPPGQSLRESLEANDSGQPVPRTRQAPDELPLGLYRDGSYVLTNDAVAHYYRSREYGLEMVFGIEDESQSSTRMGGNTTVVRIHGIDVLVSLGQAGDATGAIWVDNDIVHSLFVVRASGGLLVTSDMLLAVVEELIQ